MELYAKIKLTFTFLLSIFFSISSNGVFSQSKLYKGAELYSLSQHDIKYGKIEVRMIAAKGSGILSTFFTWKEGSEQSNVFWEEIDVEVFGKENASSWQSNIITGFDPRFTSEQVHNQISLLGDQYHTYSIEWTPDYVAWEIDEQQVRKSYSQSAKDLKNHAGIRFNIWVSTHESWAGSWNDSVLPQYQFVNWIKYYRFEDDNFILDWIDNFDEFDSSHWGKANWTFDENRADFEPENIIVKDGKLILCLTKSGETGFEGIVPIDSAEISTSINEQNDLIKTPILMQNYPNPFNPSTKISFMIPAIERVSLKIYDSLGNEISVLVDQLLSPGTYEYSFDGNKISNGVYIYRLKVGRFIASKKIILLK